MLKTGIELAMIIQLTVNKTFDLNCG